MAPEEAPPAHEEFEVAEDANQLQKRHGLREYSSENGPLIHRTVEGRYQRHFDLQTTNYKDIKTPSTQAAIDSGMKDEGNDEFPHGQES